MAWIRFLVPIILANFGLVYGGYKLCAFSHMDSHLCKAIEMGNSNVSCIEVIDSVDCALKLSNGDAHLALLAPEESVLLSQENKTDLQVIGEVRYNSRADKTNSLKMVAVVRKPISNFDDLKGKNYCHPGVGMSHHLTDHFMKYFERVVVKSSCKSWFSAAEEEIYNLANFFGDSCRPGHWARATSLENRLKRDYRKLCHLCDSRKKCTYNMDQTNSFEGALNCLTVNSGDVTYVPLQTVQRYFGLNRIGDKKNISGDFQFLCKDQQTMPLTSENPCYWGTQPWDVIVTRKDVSDELNRLMVQWLKSDTQMARWQENLKKLLLGDSKTYVNGGVIPKPLGNYIDRSGVDDKSLVNYCGRIMRWCVVSSIEMEKCEWVAHAAAAQGFKPPISCIQASRLFNCLQWISQNKADAVSIDTEYGFLARNVFNLSTVVFEDNFVDGNYQILTVLRNDNQDIKLFKDLKYKKACFPEYNGLGWNAFVNIAKSYDLLGKSCPEYFIGPSCVPGSFRKSHSIGNKTPNSMCSICPVSNSSDPCPPQNSVKEKNINALLCLSNEGDVAFVNYKALLTGGEIKSVDELIKPNLYKVLCKNGTIVQGLNVDDNCALATGISAEVVGNKYASLVTSIDTSELFLDLNKAFGTIGEATGVISIFDQFKGERKLLFKESTISLVNSDEDLYLIQINYYEKLLYNVTGTCKGSANNSATYSIAILFFTIIFCIL